MPAPVCNIRRPIDPPKLSTSLLAIVLVFSALGAFFAYEYFTRV